MLKNKQPTAVSIRATMQQQHLASARNRRLAQQMENRPSVQAALNHKQVRTKIRQAACHWTFLPCQADLRFLLYLGNKISTFWDVGETYFTKG